MCQSLTPLVVHAPRRKALRCSCGALHLVWENLNLSLDETELGDLSALAFAENGGTLGHWHVHHRSEGVGLWYGPLGTTFSQTDWSDFSQLLLALHSHTCFAARSLYALN